MVINYWANLFLKLIFNLSFFYTGRILTLCIVTTKYCRKTILLKLSYASSISPKLSKNDNLYVSIAVITKGSYSVEGKEKKKHLIQLWDKVGTTSIAFIEVLHQHWDEYRACPCRFLGLLKTFFLLLIHKENCAFSNNSGQW